MKPRRRACSALLLVPALACSGEPRDALPPGGEGSPPPSSPSVEAPVAPPPSAPLPAPPSAAPVPVSPSAALIPAPLDTVAGTRWTEADWTILQEKVRWAIDAGLDTLELGEGLARLGLTFVGAPYTPQTLEAPGPEALVVNLREFDCVTFVENVLALTWFIRNDGSAALTDQVRAMRRYEEYLTALRYRGATLSGYPSRLHYFSEWLSDNERRGLVASRAAELGAETDAEPIDFMSTHPAAYRQLAAPDVLGAILDTERRLDEAGPRRFVPQARIADVSERIGTGDVIAATSAVPGLDIAHTGIAVRRDGRLHLLHAPLVGDAVQLSETTLAERVRGISGQDGIMVAAPRAWPGGS